MSEHHGTTEHHGRSTGRPRHRRRRTAVLAGLPLALTAAGAMAYGGAFGEDARNTAAAATAAAPAWAADTADGFASVNALGQNGTYGGRDGKTVTVKTLADLEKYATAAEPYVIVVAATITMDPVGKEIKVASDKTIVGSGTSGHLVGGGFFLGSGVHNVIIRNLTIRDAYQGVWNDKEHDFDAIQMDGAHHVWIDHNDLRHMADGLIDVRKDSTYVTVSWNKLSNDNKAFGIGWTENVVTDITIHHNWIRETEQRNPSTDNAAHAHLYNNFLEDVAGTDDQVLLRQLLARRDQDGPGELLLPGHEQPRHQGQHREHRPEGQHLRLDDRTQRERRYGLRPEDVLRLHPRQDGGRARPPQVRCGTAEFDRYDGRHQGSRRDHAHRRQGRQRPVLDRAGRGERRTGEQRLAGGDLVKPGTYREVVKVPSNKPHVTIQGIGRQP